MKVLDLDCAAHHRFEGWFASEEDYVSQLARGLVACPVCGATSINRLPSAPRLNLSRTSAPAQQQAAPAAPQTGAAATQARWLRAMREMVKNTEDVGDKFAEEARRIHYAETPARGIRGVASHEEARELADEGIDVLSLPFAAALKEPLQ
jgi:hypothetical protein